MLVSVLVYLFFHILVSGATKNRACWLEASGDFRDEIAKHIKHSAKLIYIDFALPGHPPDMLDIVCKHVNNPYRWIRTTSRHGRSLLMLDENYKYMSLSTLTIGVESMSINLTDHPARCLRGKDEEQVLKIIRESFLGELVAPDVSSMSPLGNDDHICNMQVLEDHGHALFRYRCCRKHQDGNITCEDMQKDEWVQFLLALIILIKVLVILWSPMFLPETLYREKYVAAPYIFHVPGPALSLKIVVTQKPDQFGVKNTEKRIRLSDLRNMQTFKTMIANTRWEHDRVYEVKVPDIRLSVKSRRLLGQNNVPITIFKLFYNSLIRCRIRHLEPLKECCNTNILGRLNPGANIITWYRCMKIFASFVILALVAVPWFIRMAFYFVFEKSVVESKFNSAERLGLEPHYLGNIVLYLSPFHGLFIVIYVIFILDSLFLGIVSTAMKDKLKTVFRQCLRDMKERPKLVVVGWLTQLIVKPFTYFGVVGFIFFIPYLLILLVIALPISAFYVFPTLNLSIRLIIQFFIFLCPAGFVQRCKARMPKLLPVRQGLQLNQVTANETFVKRKHYSTKGIVLQILAIFMCLITFWSLTLLVMEVCSFFVELFVYTFMGLIVNAGVIFQYLSLLLLVLFYCKDILAKVHIMYLDFHKVVHKELLGMIRDEMNEVAKKEALDQENTVFNVKGAVATYSGQLTKPQIIVKDGRPYWHTKGMLVFLDRQDTPCTPEKFFHKTIDLNYYCCPGPIHKNVGNAVLELFRITLFLLFVVLVVMAFGNVYSISSTNQLLATVVGGFLPYMFSIFFKNKRDSDYFETNSIQFKTEFHKAINCFSQHWPVYDIVSTDVKIFEYARDGASANEAQDRNANNKQEVVEDDDLAESLDSEEEDEEVTLEKEVPTAMTSIIMEDNFDDVDIIVDVSTPKTRKLSPLVTKGFEKGSETMLNGSQHKQEDDNTSVIEV